MSRRRVLRGTLITGAEKKIQLDDMDISTAWRIVDFQVSGTGTQSYSVAIGSAATEPGIMTSGDWDLEESREIAWARFANLFEVDMSGAYSMIDDSAIIVQDLYLMGFSRTESAINYFLVIERLKVKKTTGIMALVAGQGQDV